MISLQDKVLSLADLLWIINDNKMNISECALQSVINGLYNEGLVFYTENHKHITTIININKNLLNR
jgi:(p)ppGpp synthase/HD superfamily hydrolase